MPTRRLIIAPTAYADLEQIWDYIEGRSSADAATAVATDLVAAFDALAEMPGVGHERSEMQDATLRFQLVHSYLIPYRFDDQTLRVVHGRRDLRRVAFP